MIPWSLPQVKKIESAAESLELKVNNICDFYEKHQLTLNADKTDFITFQTTNKNNKYKNTKLFVKMKSFVQVAPSNNWVSTWTKI